MYTANLYFCMKEIIYNNNFYLFISIFSYRENIKICLEVLIYNC